MRAWKWINLRSTQDTQALSYLYVLMDYLLYHDSCYFISIRSSFNEHVSLVRVWNLSFCHLHFAPTFLLEMTDSITALSDDQPYTIVWNCNNHRSWTRWSIRSKQVLVNYLFSIEVFWELVSCFELLRTYCVSGCFICCENFDDNIARSNQFLLRFPDN